MASCDAVRYVHIPFINIINGLFNLSLHLLMEYTKTLIIVFKKTFLLDPKSKVEYPWPKPTHETRQRTR